MFAEPSASRGKRHKAAAADANGGRQLGKEDKRQIQRATKSQRKGGGLKRGGLYEVEEVGELYTGGVEADAVAPPRTRGADVSEGESDEESEASGEQGPARAPREPAPAAAPPPAPRPPGGAAADGDEVLEIKAGLSAQLRAWAADPGLPMEEQKRLVRQLLAQWHPDKNRHIGEVATEVFQFIQEEVNSILAELHSAADHTARQEAEALERKAQRAAEKSAKAAALQSAREEKRQRKQRGAGQSAGDEEPPRPAPSEAVVAEDRAAAGEEWSLVVGHGPATTAHLRPWPRSHLSLTASPASSRPGEVLLFGGEAYDGRELTFFSDLYRLDLRGAEDASRPLPWEKVYSSVPFVPGPEARSSHQAVAWGSHLYIFGGEWSSRDQRRFRQFGDFWRIDATGAPGTRWERLDAARAPAARSGHRMACGAAAELGGDGAEGRALVFGGFTEDRRRRSTYLDDLHVVDLPECDAWRQVASSSSDRRTRPCARSGGLFWAAGGGAYVLGGTHPRKKGGEDLVVLDDLWHAQLDAPSPSASSSSSAPPSARWRRVEVAGEGPGPRSGLSQCAAAADAPGRRIVFGGVTDVRLAAGAAKGRPPRAGAEVSLFHQDVFLLECDLAAGATWFRLWPAPGAGPQAALGAPGGLSASALPPELRAEGGGVDALALVVADGRRRGGQSGQSPCATPRGRIAAGCTVAGGALWVFGGACESGPRQEVTLDDLWRMPLPAAGEGAAPGAEPWECLLSLSDRATMWFDSESEDDDDDEEEGARDASGAQAILPVDNRGGGVLSKKQQKEEDKKARMDMKRVRQQEKCEEKTSKRDMKKEQQRKQAQERRS